MISVIIPAYNIEKYIARCLDSISAQTFKDLEIIAVDDGSTDNTGSVMDECAQKDKRITVIHKEHEGVSAARNAGLDRAKGEYIGFVDGDDCIDPVMYETLLDALKFNETDIAITAYDEKGEAASKLPFSGDVFVLTRDEAIKTFICEDRSFKIHNCVWNKLYKRAVLEDLRFVKGHDSEDIMFTTLAIEKADRFVCIDKPLYHYSVQRTGSIMNIKLHERRFNDEIPFLKEQLEHYKTTGPEELYERACYMFYKRLLSYYNDFKERHMRGSAKGIASIILEDKDRVEKVYDNDFVPTGDKKRMELFLKSQGGYYLFSKMYEEVVVPLKQVPDGAIPKVARVGNICFYLGVLIEVIIMFLGKAQFTNPYEGLMFRIPFVLFVIKVLCTRYSLRDIIAMVIIGGIAVISYLTNTKDELVRFAVFLFAMKDINLKNVLIWVYKLSVAFMALLALLSMTGILGTVFERYEGYGFKEGRWRLCLGVGNSNSLAVMIWALMVLGIYLYHEKMRWVHYLILTVLSVLVYYTTLTRTTLAVMILTVLGAFVLQNFKAVRESKVIYFLGGILILTFLGFSIWSACVSDWHEFMDPEVVKISNLLTGRIESLSRFTDGGGHISNWTYFSAPEHDRYFDMGYVRFFYWYGIIPGALATILVLSSIRESYKRHDYMGFLMIMMFGLFTVVEAHIVSVYIARNYLLFLVGSYLVTMLRTGSYNKPKEAYFWRIPIKIFG